MSVNRDGGVDAGLFGGINGGVKVNLNFSAITFPDSVILKQT
jgi:hypothetical protein